MMLWLPKGISKSSQKMAPLIPQGQPVCQTATITQNPSALGSKLGD